MTSEGPSQCPLSTSHKPQPRATGAAPPLDGRWGCLGDRHRRRRSGLVWFQPQKLLIDERVDDTVPQGSTPQTGGRDPVEPIELARGEFVSLDRGTSGLAQVLTLDDGRRILRLEGLDSSTGPDLYDHVGEAEAGRRLPRRPAPR